MYEFNAKKREVGKKNNAKLIESGFVPAALYGKGKENVVLALHYQELLKILYNNDLFTSIYKVNLDGTSYRVMIKDITMNFVKSMPIHLDLFFVTEDTVVTINYPVKYIDIDTCPGLKVGGRFNPVLKKIKIRGKVQDIPKEIVCSLKSVKTGMSLFVKDLNIPKNCKTIRANDDTLVCKVKVPKKTAADNKSTEASAEAK